MQDIINLTVNTKSGEDLYVYPYSVSYSNKQKTYYYCSPEFSVNNTNNFFQKNYSLLDKLVLIKGVITVWWNYFSEDLKYLFGSYCFDRYFKHYRIRTYIKYIPRLIQTSYVFQADSVYGKNIDIRGQLSIDNRGDYIDISYLPPTTKYFDERLEEWINEDAEKLFATNDQETQEIINFYKKERLSYKHWRDTELAKGNEIEYLHSLNT